MIVSLIVFVTIVVLALPQRPSSFRLRFSPATSARSTPSAPGSPVSPSGSQAFEFKSRARKKSRRPRLHLHGQPPLQSRRARADVPSSRPHCGLPQAPAHEDSHPRLRVQAGHFIPVDRDGTVEGAQLAVADAERVLASGLHITTFVEGMRSPDGRMLPFKKGPFYLAKDSGAPCIPISIYGSEKILPGAAGASTPAWRTSSFTRLSTPRITPRATSCLKPSAPPSPPDCRSGCRG
jgi:hypothetical protein